jgi:hypothetical protein
MQIRILEFENISTTRLMSVTTDIIKSKASTLHTSLTIVSMLFPQTKGRKGSNTNHAVSV